MIVNKHTIHRQSLEVVFSDRRDGFGLQDILASIYKERILPRFNDILDECNVGGRMIEMDEFVIDAGVLPSRNWEKEFEDRAVSQFKSELQKKLLSATGSSSAQTSSVEKKDRVRSYDINEAVFLNLVHFLETGTLLWADEDTSIQKTEEYLLKLIQTGATEALKEKLEKALVSSPVAFKRFLLQFSTPFAIAVLRWLIPADTWKDTLSTPGNELEKYPLIHALQNAVADSSLVQVREELIKYDMIVVAGVPPAQAVEKDNKSVPPDTEDIVATDSREDDVQTATPQPHRETGKGNSAPGPGKPENGARKDSNLSDKSGKQATDKPEVPSAKHAAEDDQLNTSADIPESLYITNAGLIILHPYLLALFRRMELISEDHKWISDATHNKAVLVSQYLVTGRTAIAEYELPLNKILCGYDLTWPVTNKLVLSEQEIQETDMMLQAVIKNWEAVKNTSIAGLRETFLERNGKLTKKESGWFMSVEPKGFDVLLQRLPWTISIVKNPVMKDIIYTEWV